MAPSSKKNSPEERHILSFEKPIQDVRSRLLELEALDQRTSQDLSEELSFYRERLERLTQEVYAGLSSWDRVQVARHPDRPGILEFIDGCCEDWVELHGDGLFGDDRALLTGLARVGHHRILLVGHCKGKDTKERMACNFGSAHPEGYRKALRTMRMASRLGLPIVSFINTPGAYPGLAAEERGQARAIAENIHEMFGLRVPVIAVVLGEGGSGGALGIAVADRVAMLENSWYSVISPEGCASILWHSAQGREIAADALQLTAAPLRKLGIVDDVIEEPPGGAHRDPELALEILQSKLIAWLDELGAVPMDQLVADRHRKFRRMAASVATLETAWEPAQTGHEPTPRTDSTSVYGSERTESGPERSESSPERSEG